MVRSGLFAQSLLATVVLLTLDAAAEINIQEGSFNVNRSFDLFSLNYSSRSIFRGKFGYGWCSDLDQHIETHSDGRAYYLYCGQSREISNDPNWQKTRRALRVSAGRTVHFDKHGKVRLIVDREKIQQFKWEQDKSIRILTNKKEWSLQINKMGFVTKVQTQGRDPIDINYSEDLLVGWNDTNYQYDQWKNLIQIDSAKVQTKIEYDPSWDRVTQVTKGPCSTGIHYRQKLQKNFVQVEQTCASVPVYTQIHTL